MPPICSEQVSFARLPRGVQLKLSLSRTAYLINELLNNILDETIETQANCCLRTLLVISIELISTILFPIALIETIARLVIHGCGMTLFFMKCCSRNEALELALILSFETVELCLIDFLTGAPTLFGCYPAEELVE